MNHPQTEPDAAVQPAPLFRRAVAFLIDLILINLIAVVLGIAAFAGMAVALRQMGQPLPSNNLVVSLAEYGASGWPLLIIGYFGYVTTRGGQTVGKRMMKIRVVSTRGASVEPLQLWWRAVVVCATLPVFAVFALAAFTSKNRALHDYLAGTRVVREPAPGRPPVEPEGEPPIKPEGEPSINPRGEPPINTEAAPPPTLS